ncbi:MAG: saccharopine dehydrogenase [Blastocatellia bacterium]
MKILVLGAGRMGFGAAFDLARNSEPAEIVTIADRDHELAAAAAEKIGPPVAPAAIDVADYAAVKDLMCDYDAAISCVNYWFNESLARAAIEAQTHFCDLGGNNSVVDAELRLDDEARKAGISVIPDCGLAPGMVSILAMHGANRFDQLEIINIRVGGLPQKPKPPLDYQLVFSVEGLINEYVERARLIRNSAITEVDSMTELEPIEFEGFPPLEAFQTSGGTSTLPETFLGRVKELDYKTIRYRGHCERFKAMIDLGLCSSEEIFVDYQKIRPRAVFSALLAKYLPTDGPDYVLVRCEFKGMQAGIRKHLRYDIVDKFDELSGLSAMMRTTGFPAAIIARMMVRGEVSRRGATPQELAINPEKFVTELSKRGINIREQYI